MNFFDTPGRKIRLINPLWWLLYFVVVFYRLFSKHFTNKCRFHPTCSRYALDALEYYGAVKASFLIIKRLLKCQPFHEGGFDYIPALNRENTSNEVREKAQSSK